MNDASGEYRNFCQATLNTDDIKYLVLITATLTEKSIVWKSQSGQSQRAAENATWPIRPPALTLQPVLSAGKRARLRPSTSQFAVCF